METITNPKTGEIINLVDASDEQVAQLMLDIQEMTTKINEIDKNLRQHIEERVEENNNNFGEKNIKISYVRYKEWIVKDNDVMTKIDSLKAQSKLLNKDAKDLFDKNKEDAGTSKVQLKITYPKLFN
jgi:flagellar biosynthesis chaperone FliJ